MDERARPTLAGRLLARYALTVVAILGALAFVLDRRLQATFLEDLTGSLAGRAAAVRAALPEDDATLQRAAASLGDELAIRVTVIRTDGVVLADSERNPARMENHRDRPEVGAALDGDVGVDSRVSESVGVPYRYVALPPEGSRIVRVALPLSVVGDRLGRVRAIVFGGAALAAVVGVAAVWLVGRGLAGSVRAMTDSVSRMSAGDLRARVPPDGTAELALLGQTVNRLARDLEARIEEVRRDRQRRDVILEAMEDGVILVDAGDEVVFANPAAVRILRSRSVDLRTLTPHELRSLIEEAREEDRPREREVETGLPPRVLRASTVPLKETGEVLLVLRDVTATRRVEAMRRDFVADASHELKTPAAAIQAAAETVERAVHEDPEAATRFAARLRWDALRLSRIVSDLLDLSRLESERPDTAPVRLDDVVAREALRLRRDAEEAGVRVEVDISQATVTGASKDLALLARNLLDNAIRYTPRGGRVRVDVGERDGRAEVAVSDTGIGIPSRDLPRVFERFYRVDRARSRETGGTGLGLSIARHVAEQHGGRIVAESELGRGSTFRVTLPLAAPTAPAAQGRSGIAGTSAETS